MKRNSLVIVLFISSVLLLSSLVNAEISKEKMSDSEVPDNIKVLILKLNSSERMERREAAVELWEMGKSAAHAIPYLIIMLKDDDWFIRKDAIFGMSLICEYHQAEKHLIKVMEEDPVPAVRKAAEMALKALKNKKKGGCNF